MLREAARASCARTSGKVKYEGASAGLRLIISRVRAYLIWEQVVGQVARHADETSTSRYDWRGGFSDNVLVVFQNVQNTISKVAVKLPFKTNGIFVT